MNRWGKKERNEGNIQCRSARSRTISERYLLRLFPLYSWKSSSLINLNNNDRTLLYLHHHINTNQWTSIVEFDLVVRFLWCRGEVFFSSLFYSQTRCNLFNRQYIDKPGGFSSTSDGRCWSFASSSIVMYRSIDTHMTDGNHSASFLQYSCSETKTRSRTTTSNDFVRRSTNRWFPQSIVDTFSVECPLFSDDPHAHNPKRVISVVVLSSIRRLTGE